jgi:hypothetical protein
MFKSTVSSLELTSGQSTPGTRRTAISTAAFFQNNARAAPTKGPVTSSSINKTNTSPEEMIIADVKEISKGVGFSPAKRAVPPRKAIKQQHSEQNPNKPPTALLPQFYQNSTLISKDIEITKLRAQLAERDSKLKAAKTEIIEAKLAVVEKEQELRIVYAKLSQSASEKSRLKGELAATQTELKVTRMELEEQLEQLADALLSAHGINETEDIEDLATTLESVQILEEEVGDIVDEKEEGEDDDDNNSSGTGSASNGMMSLLDNLAKFSASVLADIKMEEEFKKRSSS